MAILVTGGAGYIGSHMVHGLVADGEQVVVLDNLSTGFDWAIAAQAKLVVGDIADQALVVRLIAEHGIDSIIHFAGSVVVPDSVADPLGYYRNNTVNSRALIECAVKGGVRNFIFSSTAAVYGNPAQVPVREDDQLQPMSPYGSSKLMTEIMLRDAAHAHGLSYVVLRYFNVFGPRQKASGQFVSAIPGVNRAVTSGGERWSSPQPSWMPLRSGPPSTGGLRTGGLATLRTRRTRVWSWSGCARWSLSVALRRRRSNSSPALSGRRSSAAIRKCC